MRGNKGYSLLELLAVLVIVCLMILIISFGVIGEISKARGSRLLAEAREVYTAAHIVMLEKQAYMEISDEDYMAGLRGTVKDASRPVQSEISERINALIMSDVVLSDKQGECNAKVEFIIVDGNIVSMRYETAVGKRMYAVEIEDGEAFLVQTGGNKPFAGKE